MALHPRSIHTTSELETNEGSALSLTGAVTGISGLPVITEIGDLRKVDNFSKRYTPCGMAAERI